MLDSLEINDSEMWEHLKIPKLGRVNLIVGQNGVGKTALLEAIQRTTINKTPCIWWDRPFAVRGPDTGEYRVQRLLEYAGYTTSGVLLADGIEDGLHYSIMESMWERVFNLSKARDIQIFATTHSIDCIVGFSNVAITKKDGSGVLFRLGKSARKSNKEAITATVFNAEELHTAIQTGLEVR